MNYAEIKTYDVANGPGVRTSLFVTGCTHHCENCFNQETWDPTYGKLFTEDTINEIIDSMNHPYIVGLTLLGGDPLCYNNYIELTKLVKKVKSTYPEKPIWCYTGSVLEDILERPEKIGLDKDKIQEFFQYIDVLVDGPFIQKKKNLMLKFKGSSNQRIIDLQKTLKQKKIILFME